MSTNRLTRAIALTAGGLLLAGGAAVATAGTATAAEPTHAPTSHSAYDGGYGWGHHNHDRGYGDSYGLVILVPVGGYGGYYDLGGFPGYY